jgi:hypothetical protein
VVVESSPIPWIGEGWTVLSFWSHWLGSGDEELIFAMPIFVYDQPFLPRKATSADI